MGYLKEVVLGKSGIKVSELCLGTLLIGKLQANLAPEQTIPLFQKAIEMGINFYDTAHRYGTYEHMRLGLGNKIGDVIIASKTDAKDKSTAKEEIEYCFKSLGRDMIDIYLLHQVPSREDFDRRRDVLDYLLSLKLKGRIRAVGLSSHTVEGNLIAYENSDVIDILFPILNKSGLGIVKGTLEEAIESIRLARSKNIGIYVMKPLAGGHLRKEAFDAIDFVRKLNIIDAIAIGMKTPEEVEVNVGIFSDGKLEIDEDKVKEIADIPRRVFINFLCKRCGRCIEECHQGAIYLTERKAEIDTSKCIMCGYCASVCPNFAIRVI